MHRWKLLLLPIAALACSSPFESPAAESPSAVSVRVTNTSCASAPCAPLRILAYPDNQPNTPGGAWAVTLGVITTPSACLTIPATAAFYIIAEPSHDTTAIRWSTTRSVSLGARPDSASFSYSVTTTAEFVPSSASGWAVDLPGGTRATPAAPCTP